MGYGFKVLENFAFPLGDELSLSLVCSCSLKFDKRARKLGKNITAVLLSQWKGLLLNVTMLQSEV